MIWITEIDSTKSVEDLRTSGSILVPNLPNFVTLDAKIANSLKKLPAANDFRKKVFTEEQKAQDDNGFLRGRQTALVICDHFRITGTGDSVLGFF